MKYPRAVPFNTFFRGLRSLVKLRRRVRGPMHPRWDLELETWATFLHHYGKHSTKIPLAWQRKAMSVAPRSPIVKRMRFEKVSAGGVPAEWFRLADGGDESRVLLYLH